MGHAAEGKPEDFMSSPQVYQVRFDLPSSANRYWRVYRGRAVTSAEARAYKATQGYEAKRQGVTEPLEGEVAVELNVYPASRRGDLDNFVKVTLDAANGVLWGDDRQVRELHCYRHEPSADPRVELTVATRDMAGLVLCRVRNLGAIEGGIAVDVLAELKGE